MPPVLLQLQAAPQPPLAPSSPLQELCGLTKHLQASQRNSLLLRLVGLGLFEVIGTVMRTGTPALKLRATGGEWGCQAGGWGCPGCGRA